ncbi:TonB-dependent receptor [Sphingobacterium sp. MYb382]|uniref:TonB-dependent receptor n=1 Tax=Sphingobacterium sp. MYb382 TaxID=2745278 RepID=UPI0030B263A8
MYNRIFSSYHKVSLTLLFSSFVYLQGYAQRAVALRAQVVNAAQKPIANARIQIGNTQLSTTKDGFFSLNTLTPGQHILLIQATDYSSRQDTLSIVAGEQLKLTITLTPKIEHIEAVTVSRTAAAQLKQQPIRAIVIDTRAAATEATSLNDLMNRSTGIRIRQNGGLGSRAEISINGFQGKAIKYFKDGIPLDFLGEGYNLANAPLEALDHVEVYKGILPVSLGADALGGAVNLVSKQNQDANLQAFYEYGSFNTHKTGVILHKPTKDQSWAFGGSVFYNYSDNNYKATVDVINPETKNLEPTRLPLFHNAYRHYYGELYGQIQNRNWVDQLRLSLIGFRVNKEQQHPALMTDAYGALHTKQYTLSPTLRYQKALFDKKLHIDQFLAYNDLQTERIDTLRGYYDWYGQLFPRATVGESRLASQSHIHERQFVARTNLRYNLNGNNKLNLNYVFTESRRKGTDPYGARLAESDLDVLQIGSTYQKHVAGVSIDSYGWQEKLQNTLMVKFYNYRTSGLQNTWLSANVDEKDKRTKRGSYWGIADGIRYKLSPVSLIKASAEYVYRLPDREETFGNNIFIVPNFELNPERSINLSLSYQHTFFESLNVEANGFYRRTKDLIIVVPIQAPNAQYQNQDQVKGFGFDVDLAYSFLKNYRVNANATWQDLRLFGIAQGNDFWKNDARLRNTPYFFANAGLQADYADVVGAGDRLKLFLHYNFLREFYLETIPKSAEPKGFLGLAGSAKINSNLIIPNQHLLTAGMTYKLANRGTSIGFEVRNLMDKQLFDYYRIARPGRSFHVKLSHQI